MLSAIRERLTYANVVATLALFIALGGSSYAVSKISGSQLKDASVSGKKLKRNTLGGTRIKESRLGKVPRARRADSASRLGRLTERDVKLGCPNGTILVSGVCVEQQARSAFAYGIARVQCEVAGRRLPLYQELVNAMGDAGITLAPGGELVSEVYPSSSTGSNPDALVVLDAPGGVQTVPDRGDGARQFRCVAYPSN